MWQKSILNLPPPPLQRGCGSSLKKLTCIPFTQKVVVPTLVKIGLVVLKKTMKLGKFLLHTTANFEQKSSLDSDRLREAKNNPEMHSSYFCKQT